MLTLQFGQCGNQLGESLFEQINKDINIKSSPGASFEDAYEYSEIASTKWFEGISKQNHRVARSILIDTEKKVINKIIKKPKESWCYRPKNIIAASSSGGSANNWAFGFMKKGPEYQENILNAINKELERADRLDGFLCLLSSAGGTGSGLGSYTIQTLRDIFPAKSILVSSIFPFECGEVATQHYNAILSLAKIIDDADLLLVFENEKLRSEIVSGYSGTSKSNVKIDFPGDLNEIVSNKMLSMLQPAREISGGQFNTLNHLISRISPHPEYKIATIDSDPLKTENTGNHRIWNDQYNCIKWSTHYRTLKSSLKKIRESKSLSNILITRGTSNRINDQSKRRLLPQENDDFRINDQFISQDIYALVPWLDLSKKFTHFHHNRRFLSNEKFTSIVTNNSRITRPLESILEAGWRIYTHGAFLHQYKQYGLEDDDFLRAFAKVENLVASYKNLETNN